MESAADCVLQKMAEIEKQPYPLIMAIDGRCAAGKTTLAAALGKALKCNVFHMDDFFLRPEQRTRQRLLRPGGNVDYERVREEILLPLADGKSVEYRPYDCRSRRMMKPVSARPKAWNIVEGLQLPSGVVDFIIADLSDSEAQEQRLRIQERNGYSGCESLAVMDSSGRSYSRGCFKLKRVELRLEMESLGE
ncbi:MAG: uridine kinase [Lachnospiraceae bacterium]